MIYRPGDMYEYTNDYLGDTRAVYVVLGISKNSMEVLVLRDDSGPEWKFYGTPHSVGTVQKVYFNSLMWIGSKTIDEARR